MKLKVERVIKNWKYAKKIKIEEGIFNDNGQGRRFKKQSKVNYWKEAFKEFKLTPSKKDSSFLEKNFRGGENYIGNHYLNGAYVPEHVDPAPTNCVHVRANLMLKKPSIGGNPIINGKEIEVNENDLWLCLVSIEPHSSTPIQGGERVIFSFGALIKKEDIKNIYELQ
jgi:hypothetical protein